MVLKSVAVKALRGNMVTSSHWVSNGVFWSNKQITLIVFGHCATAFSVPPDNLHRTRHTGQ